MLFHVDHMAIILHLYALFSFIIVSAATDSEALLKLKDSFTINTHVLDSWKPGSEPCAKKARWVGVLCDGKGVVGGIRLRKMGLSGKINVDALVLLPGLRSASFMYNAFSGSIPEFNRLGALKGLYISGNQFSGEIPSDYFTKMMGLKKVSFSRNNFSGPIPSSLNGLPQLIDLHLDNNHFSGNIPSLEQKTLSSLNLTNNDLEGEIPPSLARFSADSFMGNPGLCGGSLGNLCNASVANSQALPLQSEPSSEKKNVIAFGLLGAFGGILLLTVAGIVIMRRTQENSSGEMHRNLDSSDSLGRLEKESLKKNGSVSKSGSSRKGSTRGKVGDLIITNSEKGEFGMSDLMKAAAEVLGNGAMGPSYKAMMNNGLTVVVKRAKEMLKMGRDDFDTEMTRLGNLQHKNILPLLAYHYRKEEKLLIYEYQQKGSLLYILHGGDRGISHSELSWPMRKKIIQGTARGLEYLHEELAVLDLPHGNLKSSNILLSPEYEPLLSDHGLCSLMNPTQASQFLTAYKSPEALLQNVISPKCDVFCLGIIILEILTGKFPSQYMNNGQGGTDLVQLVRSAIADGRVTELLDPDVVSTTTSVGEMEQFLHIGASCTESNPDQRPSLKGVIRLIEADGSSSGRSGGGITRTFEIQPSLRDGCAERPQQPPPPAASQSWRRHDSLGEQSGRKSFAFEMSRMC